MLSSNSPCPDLKSSLDRFIADEIITALIGLGI